MYFGFKDGLEKMVSTLGGPLECNRGRVLLAFESYQGFRLVKVEFGILSLAIADRLRPTQVFAMANPRAPLPPFANFPPRRYKGMDIHLRNLDRLEPLVGSPAAKASNSLTVGAVDFKTGHELAAILIPVEAHAEQNIVARCLDYKLTNFVSLQVTEVPTREFIMRPRDRVPQQQGSGGVDWSRAFDDLDVEPQAEGVYVESNGRDRDTDFEVLDLMVKHASAGISLKDIDEVEELAEEITDEAAGDGSSSGGSS